MIELLLIVIPRSRSISIESSNWLRNSRCETPPQAWINRSARVDFPWSIWAMMQKLRIWFMKRVETIADALHAAMGGRDLNRSRTARPLGRL